MNKMMKLCVNALALVLAFTLAFGLCANAFTAFAADSADVESRKDDILKEFFGDGVTTEEAFNKLLAETDSMVDYENKSFQYVTDSDSYYVALGDETAAITTRQKSTYVDKLANALGIPYKNLAAAQMAIQDVYSTVTANSAEIAKADLITIGWSNYGATFRMCQYMGEKNPVKVTEAQWTDLVGEENMPLLEELLDQMFQQLRENSLSDFAGYDIEGGLEWYAYTYMSNAIHQAQLIEAIRVFNKDAVIVLVGTYNDLEGVALDVNGEMMELGNAMEDFVHASNLLATKNAAAYARVAYVDATDVTTALDGKDTSSYTPMLYVMAIVGRQGLPNENGHAYIANQIKDCMSDTCTHIWDTGAVTTEPTCAKEGVKTFTCTWCGEKTTESIAKVDHTWNNGVVTKQPTATTDGEKTYTCTGCGETRTEVIEKTGESEVLMGDVNGDGRFNARDTRALLRFVAGLADASEINMDAADFNGDGRVNARDARAMLRSIAGLE